MSISQSSIPLFLFHHVHIQYQQFLKQLPPLIAQQMCILPSLYDFTMQLLSLTEIQCYSG